MVAAQLRIYLLALRKSQGTETGLMRCLPSNRKGKVKEGYLKTSTDAQLGESTTEAKLSEEKK